MAGPLRAIREVCGDALFVLIRGTSPTHSASPSGAGSFIAWLESIGALQQHAFDAPLGPKRRQVWLGPRPCRLLPIACAAQRAGMPKPAAAAANERSR